MTATGIIMTSLLSYSGTVITNMCNIPLSYEVSQLLTVTVAYTNGVVNPMIYVLTHPVTRKYLKTWTKTDTVVQSSGNRSGIELRKVKSSVCVSVPYHQHIPAQYQHRWVIHIDTNCVIIVH